MSTETHYEVHSEWAHHGKVTPVVLCGTGDDHAFVPAPNDRLCRIGSRKRADELATKHFGKVRRVTITVEDVDPMRWLRDPVEPGELLLVCDGRNQAGCGPALHGGPGWRWFSLASPFEACHETATLDEAKAAAEAAVKDGWA
jgi:hypothetical protein